MAMFSHLTLIPAAGLLLALLLTGLEAGRWIGKALPRIAQPPDHLLSAMLGLLALLLGFTFSLALNRHEARRDLVIAEANAIGTTWLRVRLLDEPHRTTLQSQMRAYLSVRLDWSEVDADANAMAATQAMQETLWTSLGKAVQDAPSSLLVRGLMDSMNESFDLAAARAAARSAHLPDRVLEVLILYMLVCALILGSVSSASDTRHRVAYGLLMLLLVLAFSLILDIDRSRSGGIQISQRPLEDLAASLR